MDGNSLRFSTLAFAARPLKQWVGRTRVLQLRAGVVQSYGGGARRGLGGIVALLWCESSLSHEGVLVEQLKLRSSVRSGAPVPLVLVRAVRSEVVTGGTGSGRQFCSGIVPGPSRAEPPGAGPFPTQAVPGSAPRSCPREALFKCAGRAGAGQRSGAELRGAAGTAMRLPGVRAAARPAACTAHRRPPAAASVPPAAAPSGRSAAGSAADSGRP